MIDARWLARINCVNGDGVLLVEHAIEELGEIEEIVEHGPGWNAIESIVIRLATRRGLYHVRGGERAPAALATD